MRLTALQDTFAHEVLDLNLWKDLDERTLNRLRIAWRRHGVLLFRRQSLSESELVRFFSHFGKSEVIVRTDWQSRNRDEVIHISNMKDASGRSIGGLGSGELDWHSDQSYMTHPATGALLYMVEMPNEGGATYWANLQQAYDALNEETRSQIADLEAIYDYAKRQSSYDDEAPLSASLRRKTPPVLHPLVCVNPQTRRQSLYIDPSTMVGISGVSAKKGAALLAQLSAHATQPRFVYTHHWQIGDVVMWDNGQVLHRRDHFGEATPRWLKRLTCQLSPEHHLIPASRLYLGN
ncbi:MAG: TauD/TfdA family dioxygenase [Gammaproteobacteria bacterium]|jgi:alpha-ketoglutarate-dependent taurine dioxygenase|nr:TauD/TfdA family dioxygenase [Gammaproteobacteria bacterium]|tara:strand:- start:759 stop:1634 length:876 start_codon:yes stop_codon:yes gene_type:complete